MGEGLFGAWKMRDKVRFTGSGRHSDSVAVMLEKTLHLPENWLLNKSLSPL